MLRSLPPDSLCLFYNDCGTQGLPKKEIDATRCVVLRGGIALAQKGAYASARCGRVRQTGGGRGMASGMTAGA
jgi:hypothetical protein